MRVKKRFDLARPISRGRRWPCDTMKRRILLT
jgi:hypothetical protein